MARAEVIQGQAVTGSPEGGEHVRDGGADIHQRAFGHFDVDAGARAPQPRPLEIRVRVAVRVGSRSRIAARL